MKHDISRRSFLKGAAAGAAGFAMSALTGCTTPAQEIPATTGAETRTPETPVVRQPTYEESLDWNGLYDVIVIGYGGAGAVAALTAAENGAKVLLLEKAPKGHEGGNTKYSMQMILWNYEERHEESMAYFRYLRNGNHSPSDEMLSAYLHKSAENKEWLEAHGANVVVRSDHYPGEFPEFGCTSTTILAIDGEMGTGKFWFFLKDLVEKEESIDIWYEAPATELLRDPSDGVVLGVACTVNGETAHIRAKNGVVLSCGGFENNIDMIQNYTPLTECYAMGTQYNTGDGIKMAQAIGADLWHMDNIMGPYLQTYYPGMSRPEFYSGTIFQASYYGKNHYFYVARDGKRFMDESANPRHGYMEYNGQFIHCPAPLPVYMIFDQYTVENGIISTTMARNLDAQVAMGAVHKADSIEELAEQIGLDAQILRETLDDFNAACAAGKDKFFNRSAESLNALTDGPYYAAELKPAVINTQGGPVKNINAEILDVKGNVIPHLYGAGECGEIFSYYYQGAGNLSNLIAGGRTAGENAAAAKMDRQPSANLPLHTVVPVYEEKTFELGANEYLGTGEGICGPVTVKVAVDSEKRVEEVTVLDSKETDTFGGWAVRRLPARFVGMSRDEVFQVDGITKATFTSGAIKTAVYNALSAAEGESVYENLKDGTYTGSARGFKGDIELEVVVSGGEISSIRVLNQSETETVGGAAFSELIDQALSAQGLVIDGVSGATVTSSGFKEAMRTALDQAQ